MSASSVHRSASWRSSANRCAARSAAWTHACRSRREPFANVRRKLVGASACSRVDRGHERQFQPGDFGKRRAVVQPAQQVSQFAEALRLWRTAKKPRRVGRRRQFDPRRQVRQLLQGESALVFQRPSPPAQLGARPRVGGRGEVAGGGGHALEQQPRRRRACAGPSGGGRAAGRSCRTRPCLPPRRLAGSRPRSGPAPRRRPRPASRPIRRTRPDWKIGMSPMPFNPAASVSRWPARLPLSTVETYSGRSGSSVRVSYQLYRCPRYRWSLSTAASVRDVRAMTSPAVM